MSLEHFNAVDPQDGERCLQRAYSACQTATLMFVDAVDVVSTDYALITRCGGGKSVVSVTSEFFGDSGPPPPFTDIRAVTTDQCAGMSQSTESYDYADYAIKGLLINQCNSGRNVFLPARPENQQGNVCGTLRSDQGRFTSLSVTGSPSDPPDAFDGSQVNPQVEDCFWRAYTNCSAPTTMVYIVITDANDVTTSMEHTLVVQPTNGTCTLTDATYIEIITASGIGGSNHPGPTYTCASLTRDMNGYLTARHCGAEGDVMIAPPTPSAATP
jgi:hypothetical protein